MCISNLRTFWKEYKELWHDREDSKHSKRVGIILPWLIDVFTSLDKLSCIRFRVWRLKRRKQKFELGSLYKAVDWYIIGWLIFEIGFFFWVALFQYPIHNSLLLWIMVLVLIIIPIMYRLFDIFQDWVSQFVLGGVPEKVWQPIDIYRSLVLVFIGYFEVIFDYATFAIFFQGSFLKDNFQNI